MKNCLTVIAGVALITGMLQGKAAHSAVMGALTFAEPTGTVAANESIEVWVTLTLSPNSDPLTYKPAEPFPHGIDPAHLPNFDSYEVIYPFIGLFCDNTFIGCNDPDSQYSLTLPFGTGDLWNEFDGTINPGESRDFLFFELIPEGGSAAPGTYEMSSVSLGLTAQGLGPHGTLIEDIYYFETDCAMPSCSFTRTVAPVPLPAAAWLFGSALLGLAGIKRRNA